MVLLASESSHNPKPHQLGIEEFSQALVDSKDSVLNGGIPRLDAETLSSKHAQAFSRNPTCQGDSTKIRKEKKYI